MNRLVFCIAAVSLAACGASTAGSPGSKTAQTAQTAQNRGLEGDPCVRDSDCNMLWCVNGECTRRDP